MKTVNVQIEIPKGIAPYLNDEERIPPFERNAMMIYPFIQKGIISHGRAAELLEVRKWDLIEFYNSIGIPYLNQSKEELLADLATFDKVMEKNK